ncbi:LCP family glycopolymer transferase CpsA [Streptococcus sobrinus]|uniref:LCP family glycopolymer transferase CpsA n=3 Tax=Streptococcus sobrinus TaxID=1310 RepID=UPI0002D50730|nr:LCP family protein [Streptococcus sobrinus]AWN62220.1 LytR family transcriptional regulator [Streptococcus sobrinus]AWN64094.1 LytR family transcriptional regulator [Streptococcus sobrinus]SQG21210.1 transcriptional regulator [Streptococcus sobrinus]
MARHNRSKSKSFSTHYFVNILLFILYTAVSAMTLFLMYKYNFLASRYLNVIFTILLVAVFALTAFLIIKKRSKIWTSILLVVFTIVSALTFLGLNRLVNFVGTLNDSTKYSQVEMSIVVPKDSSIKDLSDVDEVEAPTQSDGTNIDEFVKEIKADKSKTITVNHVDSYAQAYNDLMSGSTKAIILNSAYASLIENQDKDFKSKVKTIYSHKIQTANKVESNKKVDTNAFNIYISGIDTYGPINSVSRSDVNIIASINLKTHKVLLTTTPRDAYVTIPDGGNNQKDKLTHAGIYGVQTSMKTLENLYNINIDYYARLNFTSFLKLVDLLGGIDVYNDQAFTAHTNKDYTFEVGNVHLDSQGALAFVRERYGLENGDNDRGKNQEKVITAIINKLASTKSISKISSIANNLQDSIQTNMPISDLMTIANTQLESGSSFKVSSQAVTGTGSTGELQSYAMPGASLYMMQLDDSSVSDAADQIKDVLGGK